MRKALVLLLSSGLWACNPGTAIYTTTSGSSGSTAGLSNSSTSSGTTGGSATATTDTGSTTSGVTSGTTSGTTGSASASAASGTTSGVPDPTVNGRYSVIQGSAEITSSVTGDTIPIIYDYPTSSPDAGAPAAGSCPIVLFAHGFLIDASAYEVYASRLSSFGYVVVIPNYPDANEVITSANDKDFMHDVLAGLDFALNRLPQSDPKVTHLVDASEIGISGHSLGGKLAIMAAEQDAGIKASINFDPVDDTSCGGNCPSAVAAMGNLNIPTAFLGETTDQATGTYAACAPPSDNFQVFYNAAQSPSLQGTIAGAGSSSFLDDQSGCGLLGCFNCTKGNGTNTLDISHAMLVAFYERYLRNNTGYDAWLTGTLPATTWPSQIAVSSK